MGSYKDLFVYKESFQAAIKIYKFSLELPKYLQYDIADDIRRAARSVPSNIAEGYAREKSSKDIKNFLKTSLGSNDEVIFNLDFLYAMRLLDSENHERLKVMYKKIGSGLRKLITNLETNTKSTEDTQTT